MKRTVIYTTLAVFATPAIYAMNCDVDLNLKSFHTNPKKFLNSDVVKLDQNCKKEGVFSYFSEEKAKDNSFVKIKDNYRSTVCHTDTASGQRVCLKDIKPGEDVEEGRAPIQGLDRAENLVSGGYVEKNIYTMAKNGLEVGNLDVEPWSDWYWPIAVGQLSYRYADYNMLQEFRRTGKDSEEQWSFMIDYHRRNKPLMLDINLLSPAEKYDMLVGDTNFTLTNTMLNRPRGFAKNGKVESWMGICHGWAPASYMLPRPVKSITVKAADGVTDITFKPTDLKALGSQLWASGYQSTKMVGGRCNIDKPKTDSNGRVLDQNCFDNNPGTWHQIVVNQLGKNKMSFVMDATYDYQVWNHPVTAYSYKYFNPVTMQEYKTVDEAVVSMRKFSNDKFKRYRSRNAKFVVGIKMEVQYLVETMPSDKSFDKSAYDAHNTAYYVYDLELDRNYNIIGGEWYSNKHPDFLWTPYDNSHATSVVDNYVRGNITVDNIQSIRALPRLARQASQKEQPIGKIVEALLQAASEE